MQPLFPRTGVDSRASRVGGIKAGSFGCFRSIQQRELKLKAGSPKISLLFKNSNFRVKLRRDFQRGNARTFKVSVKELPHAVGRNRELASSVDLELPENSQGAAHDTTLQQRAIVAESEMVRAGNHDS